MHQESWDASKVPGGNRVEPAICFGTGLAAECALFLAVLKAGDHVICSQSVYGGTTRCLRELLSGLGIETTFVDTTELARVRKALTSSTKLIFVETAAMPATTMSLKVCRHAPPIAFLRSSR